MRVFRGSESQLVWDAKALFDTGMVGSMIVCIIMDATGMDRFEDVLDRFVSVTVSSYDKKGRVATQAASFELKLGIPSKGGQPDTWTPYC
jgi:hypothetical protein